jgi:hypothetical protein
MIERIFSGGQTGADRGGLDAAIDLGIEHGGWCPKGRLAEDGAVPGRYRLRETATAEYAERTRRNVEEADATAIFTRGAPTGGSALTAEFARRAGKPLLAIDLSRATPAEAAAALRRFVEEHAARTLNVAGSRESFAPGIAEEVRAIVRKALGPP